ncbi:MAG TPA: hypothetical protein VK639_10645 [Terriglobales bacterium]|nr:hypothetical protein [Terriglobales bacterium]
MSKPAMTNFVQALIAVLAGNAIYFILIPYLPAGARHVPLRVDAGLAVDFWFCLVVFGILKTLAGRRRGESRLHKR